MNTNRQYTSVEILGWENNELAIEDAIGILKSRLDEAPEAVLNDVLQRCDATTHQDLIGWISDRIETKHRKRLPRDWSPKRNRSLWILYAAADLNRPQSPPKAA